MNGKEICIIDCIYRFNAIVLCRMYKTGNWRLLGQDRLSLLKEVKFKGDKMSADKERLSALVVRLQQGDGNAFEEIYNLTRESAYFTALKISKNENDAEDILQETYIHILERINTLEP